MARYSALGFLLVLAVSLIAVMAIQSAGIGQRLNSGLGFLEDLSDNPASSNATPVKFVVNRGESTREIADRLQKAGLIRSAWYFSSLAQAKGSEASLQAGEYELRADMRPSEVLARLQRGVTRGHRIVVPEGWRAAQIADALAAQSLVDRSAFLSAANQVTVDMGFGRPAGTSIEGYLFPDTYYLPAGASSQDIAVTMVRNFEKKIDFRMRQRAADRKLSIHQVITMASIVEREAVVAAERPAIAGVFYNRLSAGMLLQADPTVQYATAGAEPSPGEYWKKDLTMDDLKMASPYNTYVNKGLPPGPICSPGLASIQAAIDPETTDFLYFVARPDGTHIFSRTYEEHLNNVKKQR